MIWILKLYHWQASNQPNNQTHQQANKAYPATRNTAAKMPSTSQNHSQKGNSEETPPSIRRGAVSVQTVGEYQKLQLHKNDKDKLFQYKHSTKAQK
jgi:hypothetical protein